MLYYGYMDKQFLAFPKGFLWGTASSSYQVEGGLTNDWSEWEKSSRRLKWLKKRGLDPLEYQSGLAANSWERMEDDIACIKRLNNNAYRFSVEWSRIEPEEGVFNEEALEKYRHFVRRLKEEGIEPFITLWHWPVPLWLRAQGAWEKASTIERFIRYAEKVVTALPEVKFWITLNEVEGYVGNGYLTGIWPPAKHNFFLYRRVLNNLIAAHNQAYGAIKKINPAAQVTIATPQAHFVAAPDPISRFALKIADWWWNKRFLSHVIDHIDFIGLNYYWEIDMKYLSFSKTKGPLVSDRGWSIRPEGLYHVLVGLKKYGLPIYITENGISDSNDSQRPDFIRGMLSNAQRAIAEGVDLRGYFYWSLLDNFEWAFGYASKFGLYSFDKKTWERSPRPSADLYGQIAKDNGLSVE